MNKTVAAKKQFARHVRDALVNYHDTIHLQTHPLAALLVLSDDDRTAAQSLRQALREAIESLRPAADIPFGRPEWLSFRVLWARYVDALSVDEMCQELSVSRATFYRAHREALAAVTSLLWERLTRDGQTLSAAMPAAGTDQVMAEVARVVDSSQMCEIDLEEILKDTLRMLRPIAEQQSVGLRLSCQSSLPMIRGNPSLLRQMLLSILTELLRLEENCSSCILVMPERDQVVVCIDGLRLSSGKAEMLLNSPGFMVSQGLLDAHGGALRFDQDATGNLSLRFSLPCMTPKTILMVDDDADTISLYRRYLQGQELALRVARNWDEVMASLMKEQVDLILLDVLIPDQDGWDILQHLKASPQTASIPVVVCSVLSQPRLALSLGAEKVLQKPIDQAVLLRTVRSLTGEDSGKPDRQEELSDSANRG